MIVFNGSKKVLSDHHFTFRGEEIKNVTIYKYLELLGHFLYGCMWPIFAMHMCFTCFRAIDYEG